MKVQLDPRTKILALLMIVIMIMGLPDEKTELICLGMICFWVMLHGAFRQCALAVLMYAGIWFLLRLCPVMPQMLASVVAMVCLVARKMMLPLLFTFGILFNTKVSSLMSALQSMKVPHKVTIPLAVGLRYFPTAKQEMRCIKDAMKLRGIQFNLSNILKRPQVVFEGSVIPLMLRGANIAEELSAASITRGIDSGKNRIPLESLHLGWKDVVCLAGFGILCVITMMGGLKLP